MSGDDLRSAGDWLEFNAAKQPEPAPLQRRCIQPNVAARERLAVFAQRRQRSIVAGVVTALVVVSLLALLAFGLFRQFEERRVRADNNGATATNALGLSEQRGTPVAVRLPISICANRENENNCIRILKVISIECSEGPFVSFTELSLITAQAGETDESPPHCSCTYGTSGHIRLFRSPPPTPDGTAQALQPDGAVVW